MTYFLGKNEMLGTIANWRGDNDNPISWEHNDELIYTIRSWLVDMDDTFYDDYAIADIFLRLMNCFQPAPSKEKGPLRISVYSNRADFERERRTMMKPGRAFKKMFPHANDAEIQSLTDSYNLAYDTTGYSVTIGKTRDDFKNAYLQSNHGANGNPRIGPWAKPMASSCMRYDFAQLGTHPCEVYASGDFEILTVKDASGGNVARAVIMVAKQGESVDVPAYAPIYGLSTAAIEIAENKLKEMGAFPADRDQWDGAQLLAISDGDSVIMPYLDVGGNAVEYDEGDSHLIISRYGDYNGSTSGYFEINEGCACSGCGDRVSDDDLRTSPNGDESYCEDCFYSRFTMCERCEEYCDSEETETVHTLSGSQNVFMESWCSDCAQYHATDCVDGNRWSDDNAANETEDGESVPDHFIGDNYFISDESGYAFGMSEYAETESGDVMAESEIDTTQFEYSASRGVWVELENQNA